jgi:hypothetical protein
MKGKERMISSTLFLSAYFNTGYGDLDLLEKRRNRDLITFTAVARTTIRMIRDGRELKSRDRLSAPSAIPKAFNASGVMPKMPGVLRMATARIIWAISTKIPEIRVAGDQFLCPSMKPLKTIWISPMMLIHGRKLKKAAVRMGNVIHAPSLIYRMANMLGYRLKTINPRTVKIIVAM